MSNPVAQLRGIRDGEHRYEAIVLWCPGCEQEDEEEPGRFFGGLHMLAVSGDTNGRPVWSFDGNLEAPTLSPSILTSMEHARRRVNGELVDVGRFVCHSFLRGGVWEFLSDCTHQFAGQQVPAKPLPDWVVREA